MIDSINSVRSSYPVKFQGNENVRSIKGEKEGMKTSTKVAIGTGLAALAAVGVYLLKKGKGNIAETIEKFKDAGGKFIDGKAFTNDGKPFSGIISTIDKNGKKSEMKYVEGVLQEVETFLTRKFPNGETTNFSCGKKVYKYNDTGKLETVDKYSFVHVDHMDPKKSGFQYIKTASVNLDEKRAQGLKNHAEKKAKEEAIRELMSKFNEISRKSAWKADIDIRKFNDCEGLYDEGFGIGHRMSKDYLRLKRQYRKQEEIEERGRKFVQDLEDKLKGQISADVLPLQTSKRDVDYLRLTDHYRRLEKLEIENKARVKELKAKMHQPTQISSELIDEQIKASEKIVKEESDKLKNWLLSGEKDSMSGGKEPMSGGDSKILDDLKKSIQEASERKPYDFSETEHARAWVTDRLRGAWSLAGQEFRPVNKIVGGYHIIYEGLAYDITANGELLRKVLVKINGFNKIKRENVTEIFVKDLVKKSQAEAARIEAEESLILRPRARQIAYVGR